MKLNLSKIRYSKKDIIKSIKIPEVLTTDLAEIIGLHIGDGHLGNRKDRCGYVIQCGLTP